MDLEADKIRLIDISSEDDFLIGSHLDRSSFDLRLSVACETQNELVCSLGRAKDAVPLSFFKKQEAFKLDGENVNDECSLRNSMAWDTAFFTSPGFLEPEELCLVNRGFKNHEGVLPRGNEENVRSKICLERDSSNKPAVQAGSRQRTPPLIEREFASSSKVASVQDSKLQHSSRRSAAIPKSAAVRKESLKPTRTTGLTRAPTTHTKKSPLKVVKSGEISAAERLGASKSRRPDSWSVSSVSSSRSVPSSNSVDLSPYRNCSNDARSPMRSPVMQGECPGKCLSPTSSECPVKCLSPTSSDIRKTSEIDATREVLTYDVSDSQNLECRQSHYSSLEQRSLTKGLLRQSAPGAAAKRSPIFADTQHSSKPSSLRVPSQKISFFDRKSEVPEPQDTHPEARAGNSLKILQSKENKLGNKLKYPKSKDGPGNKGKMCNDNLEAACKDRRSRNQHEHQLEKQIGFLRMDEKENIFHPEDTIIEIDIKHKSPLPSNPGAKTNGQCSSSSGKHLLKTRKPTQQTKPSLASTRIPFSIRGSPLKRSAFF